MAPGTCLNWRRPRNFCRRCRAFWEWLDSSAGSSLIGAEETVLEASGYHYRQLLTSAPAGAVLRIRSRIRGSTRWYDVWPGNSGVPE